MTGINGTELWKSDGTEAGTVLVKDINPGSSYGYGYGSNPYELTAVGGTLFFTANDGTHRPGAVEERRHRGRHRPGQGHQPRRDPVRRARRPGGGGRDAVLLGQRRGERRGVVEERRDRGGHRPGQGHQPRQLLRLSRSAPTPTTSPTWAGRCSSRPTTGRHSLELWKSDGTEAGTVLVKDINPGGGGSAGSLPNHLTAVDGTLYFTAFDPDTGIELWKSDGTEAGHRPGRGHPPRQRQSPVPTTWRSSTGRCSSPPTTAATGSSPGDSFDEKSGRNSFSTPHVEKSCDPFS